MSRVLRVYLDQNKWIDLARAATGHAHGARFVDALAAARAAIAAGTASFPLDIYRYLETGKRRNDRSRTNLADVMFELSQQHTMARPHALLPSELDETLKRRFGRPEHPRRMQVFGTGLAHITAGTVNLPSFDFSKLPDDGAVLSTADLAAVNLIFNQLLERELLRVGPETVRAAGFDPAETEFGQRFVDYENSIAAAVRERGLTGALVDVAVRASDLGNIQSAVTDALLRIGVTWGDFEAWLTPSNLMSFMDDLPTRYVTNVMRSSKLRQSEQKWESNDFNDIAALPVAAVHCDVVVTEKQWIHHLRQGQVDERYDTILISDTAELVDVLKSTAAV
jgi:hypothetical protein